jgi:hypothetical protein
VLSGELLAHLTDDIEGIGSGLTFGLMQGRPASSPLHSIHISVPALTTT